jgi:hypothetical protein
MSDAKAAWLAKGVFDVKAPSGTVLGLRFPEPEDAIITGGVKFGVAGQVKALRDKAEAEGIDLEDEEALGAAIGDAITEEQMHQLRLLQQGWVIAAVMTVDGEPTELTPEDVRLIPSADRELILKFAQRKFNSEKPEDVEQAEELGLPKDAFSPRASSASASRPTLVSSSPPATDSASIPERTSETV